LATTLTRPQVPVNLTKSQLEEKIETITEGVLPPYLIFETLWMQNEAISNALDHPPKFVTMIEKP
jgi:hypothetical protein